MYNRIESFWQTNYYYPFFDVVIVGGGFTGLIAGIELLLSKPKLKIGIFESQPHGTMASSRNAGFMCFGSPTEILADIAQHGETAVVELLQQKSVGYACLLQHLAGNKGIYRKCNGYELFDSQASQEIDEIVHAALPKLNALFEKGTGLTDYYTYKEHFHANAHFRAIKFKQEGQIHPTAAIVVLMRKFMNLGGVFHAGNAIRAWTKSRDKYVLQDSVGKQIETRQFILANNAFVSELLPEEKVLPQRAQVLVTAPIKKLAFHGNFHMNKGFVYFRNVGNRLLLGGLRNMDFETEQTGDAALNTRIQNQLDQFLKTLMPTESVSITHRWAGIMGFRQDKTPALHIHQTGIIVAAGLNGMGTLLGPAMGKQAARAALKLLK